jgi:hypothetical protein
VLNFEIVPPMAQTALVSALAMKRQAAIEITELNGDAPEAKGGGKRRAASR